MRSIGELVDLGLEVAIDGAPGPGFVARAGAALAAAAALGLAKHRPWITREGKLGGPGYTTRPERERQRLLRHAVEEYGYRSTLGSLQVLLRGHHMAHKKENVIERDRRWLVRTFGGPGSFS
jgi:hypothetical protein